MKRKRIAVLDFGSQYAHLIAKRLRLQGFYAEIERPSAPLDAFDGAAGIIMSGGPSSVYDEHVPQFNRDILSLDVPVLGLCYGHQLMASCYGGAVEQAAVGEFGFAQLEKTAAGDSCPLFDGVPFPAQVWMSHQDAVTKLPEGFEAVAATRDCAYAAVQDLRRRRFGFQFHAEVKDTPCGAALFANFARFCGMEQNWDQDTVLSVILENIGDGYAADAAYSETVGFTDQRVTHAGAAGTVRTDEQHFHVLEVALRNGKQLAIFVSGELYSQTFIVLEALIGLFEYMLDQRLVAESVIVINDVIQCGFHCRVLHALEVAAGSVA